MRHPHATYVQSHVPTLRSAGAVRVRGLVKGMEVGQEMGGGAGRGVAGGGFGGDSQGDSQGTRWGFPGDSRSFWGTRSENGACSSGFRGTRPRPRLAFIILKGGSEVLEVACGVFQSSTVGLHLKFYGQLATAF